MYRLGVFAKMILGDIHGNIGIRRQRFQQLTDLHRITAAVFDEAQRFTEMLAYFAKIGVEQTQLVRGIVLFQAGYLLKQFRATLIIKILGLYELRLVFQACKNCPEPYLPRADRSHKMRSPLYPA